LTLARDGREATLRCAPGWAQTHPRTVHLLGEERDAWARSGVLVLVLIG
jgi:exopolyphosphatase/guanosine-5'-triphosphate,3'-diphosphate pyrophosphatase